MTEPSHFPSLGYYRETLQALLLAVDEGNVLALFAGNQYAEGRCFETIIRRGLDYGLRFKVTREDLLAALEVSPRSVISYFLRQP